MSDNDQGRFGSGLRPQAGTNRVVLKDKAGIIYGWKILEAIQAKGGDQEVRIYLAEGIDLDLYFSYLKVHFGTVPEVRAILDKSWDKESVSVADLRAIDGAITLYETDARALAQIKRDALAGKIPGIDPGEYA